ncbi:MAG: pyrroline-5-carboxylate reductase family protein, partial [Acidimicrobiia bacterium]
MVALQIVGGGRMGEALVRGLLTAGGWRMSDVVVVEKDEARRGALADELPGVEVVAEVVEAQGSVVAVKPGDVVATCAAIAQAGSGRLLSIAAGVTIGAIEAAVAPGTPVVRAMPNTPAVIGRGASALAPGTAATEDDLAWASSILGAVGVVVTVPEPLLDAVTGLSGSGP